MVEGGDRDVGTVELEEGEEFEAEVIDFGGGKFVIVGGEVVEDGFGDCGRHVAAGCHGIAEDCSQLIYQLI